jgi:hypothetical protein
MTLTEALTHASAWAAKRAAIYIVWRSDQDGTYLATRVEGGIIGTADARKTVAIVTPDGRVFRPTGE